MEEKDIINALIEESSRTDLEVINSLYSSPVHILQVGDTICQIDQEADDGVVRFIYAIFGADGNLIEITTAKDRPLENLHKVVNRIIQL